ncbi:MAG TPA: methyltransferase domain-containing protein [Gemmatimonadaceae bacterium]|nr:methyltransferase domain-containing protein [Gemmatimonadaceae bacterium]
MSGAPQRVPPVPAVLRLVQLAVLGKWRATGDDLYREVARLAEAAPGREIIVSGCGMGSTTEWLARRTGASVTGVDPGAEAIEAAEAAARSAGTQQKLHYQHAMLDDLPHETSVFDVGIGEPALAAAGNPAAAVGELVRVTRPMGIVLLLQPTWSSEITSRMREMLVQRYALRPHLLVEWKQMLRGAGVVELEVQDWTSGAPGSRTSEQAAISSELSWTDKARIVSRAWRRGWRAARGALEEDATLLRELSRERAIGFQLIKGIKWPHAIVAHE